MQGEVPPVVSKPTASAQPSPTVSQSWGGAASSMGAIHCVAAGVM